MTMSTDETSSSFNETFVRPAAFYINGFTDIPHAQYYYVFLCFVYIMTVVGNGFLMSVIYLVKTLHSAKYMIVFSLALTDLCGSTALIPKVLDTFLFDRRYIVYEACLSYMFFVYLFACLQSLTLLMMGFDRFVAICFPLSYHQIVTKAAVAVMLLCVWGSSLSVLVVVVGLIDHLSFCGSLVVKSFFCDHGPVYKLACNDTSLNYIIGTVALTLFDCIPLLLIAMTYVCIAVALSRIASGAERLKALKTCSSHVILVAVFFLPLLGTNIAGMTSYIHPIARMVNFTLTHTVPALLNPIIYSLRTEEVMKSIKKLWKNTRPNNISEMKI